MGFGHYTAAVRDWDLTEQPHHHHHHNNSNNNNNNNSAAMELSGEDRNATLPSAKGDSKENGRLSDYWFICDDDHVRYVPPEQAVSTVKTSAAYILFYRRRIK
jgi:spore germination protein GerM